MKYLNNIIKKVNNSCINNKVNRKSKKYYSLN